ncbi:MAG: sugar transferase, partial [Ignavibacteria bacterium]|nr:sugar transferase [Ignavibacteria bacterium]
MSKRNQILLLLLSDTIAIILTYIIYYYIRIESGWIMLIKAPSFFEPLVAIYIYWLIIFSISGLYQHWFVKSRFDEISAVFKAITIGTFILFFVILVDDVIRDDRAVSRLLIFIYWIILIFFVSLGRFIIRGIQRNLFRKGIGLRNTIIVGTSERALSLKSLLDRYPEHGYKFIGFISIKDSNIDVPVLGSLSEIDDIIQKEKVQEIIVVSDKVKSDIVFEIMKKTSGLDVGIKIMPDMYEIISGMAKTTQIHGAPLI